MIKTFFIKYWKQILAVVLVIILIYVLRKSLKNTIQKVREANIDNSDDSYVQQNVQL